MRRLGLFLLACLLWAGSASAQINTNAVCRVTTVLTNAQVKALPTTPREVLAAPGANKVLMVLDLYLITNWEDADKYTNISSDGGIGYMNVYHGAEFLDATAKAQNGDVFGASSPRWSHVPTTTNVNIAEGVLVSKEGPLADSVNQALNLYVYNGSPSAGNFTGGNAANTLTISMLYSILNTTTGAFVACP